MMTKFNAFTYADSVKEAGFTAQQARIHAQGFLVLIDELEQRTNELASKEDLKNVEQRLDTKIDRLEEKMNAKINTVETVLSTKINAVDMKLSWLITMMGAIGALLALMNFFHVHY